VSPIELAVALDRPHLLRQLLKSKTTTYQTDGTEHLPPPLLAVEKGHEECLQLLLANSPSVVLVKDAMGNNILHASCNLQVPLSTFQLVVDVVSSAALSKAALSRNALACKHGRIALDDAFLSSLNFSLLAKVLVVQDQQAQTPFLAAVGSGSADVVMGLLMWRGNNHESISSKNAKCPLAWAVRTRNVDTVLLLLVTNHISSGDSNKTRRHNISVLCRSDSVNDVAKIRMPNDEELRSFRESIKSKYPSLKRVWGSMDGLKLLLPPSLQTVLSGHATLMRLAVGMIQPMP
jgi:ankyrin repeat protein